jgi:hypothetical protein
MDAYGKAWTTVAIAAALLGITIGFAAIAASEPAFAAAALTVTATAAHVRARMLDSGVQTPAEAGIAVCVLLGGLALFGLLGLFGSVTWALLATLAITGFPLTQRQRSCRSLGEASSAPAPLNSSMSPDACLVTDEARARVGDSARLVPVAKCEGESFSSFGAADNEPMTQHASVPARGSPNQQTVTADSLSTRELCRAWVRSYTAMQMTSDPLLLARISHARQVYLEALEERDPVGVGSWLSTDAKANLDPTPYLTGPPLGQDSSDAQLPGPASAS